MPRAKKTSKAKPKSAKRASGGVKKRSVKAAGKTARKVARKAAKKTARKAVKKTARKTARKAVKKTARKAVKKTARKAVKKTARKVVKKTARKAVKKTARKTARKAVKKTARKVVKKTTKKTAKVSSKTASQRKPGSKGARPTMPRIRHSQSRIRELTMMLEAKRAQIMDEIKRARQDSMETHGTSFPEVGDLVSASVEKERAFEYGEAVINALREINTALEKLKAGTYGVCEVCNKAIGVKRLQVVPSARLCVKCKSRQEAFGGMDPGRPDTFND